MPIRPENLAATLKRGLAPVYLVAGDEPLLIEEAMAAVRAAAAAEGFVEREVVEHERSAGVETLRSICASGSLFASRRLVELRCGAQAPDAALGKFLTEFIHAPPPDLRLLVRCAGLDGRQRNSAWARAVDKAGGFVYCWPVRVEALPRWAEARLRRAGLSAEPAALELLVERTEGNLLALAQDIEKLKLLADAGRPLSVEQVREAVADSAHTETFEWIARIMAGDARAVARGLWRLQAQGEALPAVVGALAWNLRIVVAAAEGIASGETRSAVMARLNVPKPRQAMLSDMLSRVKYPAILRWQAALVRIDANAKSGRERQGWEDLLACALGLSGARRKRA